MVDIGDLKSPEVLNPRESSSLSPGTHFMQSPYGKVLDEIPAGFVPPEAWPEFGHITQPAPICAREEVGTRPSGIRWSLWPVTFEEYVTDEEPKLADADSGPLARNRIVFWKRISRTDAPAGWHSFSRKPWRLDGIAHITPDYSSAWDKKARHELRKWQELEGVDFKIEEVSVDEYVAAYKQSTVARRVGLEGVHIIEELQLLPHKDHTILWGVRDLKTGRLVAGCAPTFSPTNSASVYRAPFILAEAKKLPVMTGLVDHWCKEMLARGIQTQVFTHFWQPGELPTWKGFSLFKSRFVTDLVAYPPILWRLRGGKIF